MNMKAKEMVMMIAAVMITAALVGCASQTGATQTSNKSARDEAIAQATPIRTEPAQRPTWVDSVPDSPTTLSFVGSAGRYATATGNTGARYYAEENGRTQLVDYYGTLMVNQARTHAATYGITSDVLAPQIAGQQLNERIAQNVAQALAPREYYTLVYLDDTNREAFEVYVRMEVDKALVRRVIDNYGQEQAADYAKKAAAEQDAARRQQLEKAAEFFGGNLSSKLGF
jgi:archaellum component FlaG (FlaF/FlaG flagellin family)